MPEDIPAGFKKKSQDCQNLIYVKQSSKLQNESTLYTHSSRIMAC